MLWTIKRDSLPFLDCTVHTEEERSLNNEVNRKPIHTDKYCSDSHHPWEHKRGNLKPSPETMPTKSEGKEKEQKHIRGTLKTCGYPNWTFVKTAKRSRADRDEEMTKHNIVIPYGAGTIEKLRRISVNKNHTPIRHNIMTTCLIL